MPVKAVFICLYGDSDVRLSRFFTTFAPGFSIERREAGQRSELTLPVRHRSYEGFSLLRLVRGRSTC